MITLSQLKAVVENTKGWEVVEGTYNGEECVELRRSRAKWYPVWKISSVDGETLISSHMYTHCGLGLYKGTSRFFSLEDSIEAKFKELPVEEQEEDLTTEQKIDKIVEDLKKVGRVTDFYGRSTIEYTSYRNPTGHIEGFYFDLVLYDNGDLYYEIESTTDHECVEIITKIINKYL